MRVLYYVRLDDYNVHIKYITYLHYELYIGRKTYIGQSRHALPTFPAFIYD
jgi:hypothetical protein